MRSIILAAAWRAVALAIVLGMLPGVSPAQEADTIRVGSEALQGARLAEGDYAIVSTIRLDGTEEPHSRTRQSVHYRYINGEEVVVIRTHHESARGETTRSSIIARASDLSLLHHRVIGEHDSTAAAVNAGHLTGWVVMPEQPIELLDRRLDQPVFPIEGQMPWLFPLLPLEDGYAAAIPHYSEWQGGEKWQTIRVVGSEALEHNGKTVDCWKIDGGELFWGHNVTYWVDKESRVVVQSVARKPEGGREYWAMSTKP